MKKWKILHQRDSLDNILSVENIISILLKNRGLTEEKEIEEFLNPKLENLKINNLNIDKKELEKAVVRIQRAIEKGESIIVYSDYDVDGICGGAIVWETLYKLGARVTPYIPHREKEGYGLSKVAIDLVKKKYQSTLIITVDHGISSKDHIKYAKSLGIDTIVVDHHLVPVKLPQAVAIIHTTSLSAGGIAWFFSNYIKNKLINSPVTSLSANLDLAAMATIADLVPLNNHNRVIAFHGLKELNKTKRIGLQELIKQSGLKKGSIGAYEVGFILAPRINASGRLESALDALRLILTRDRQRALNLARKLNLMNRKRQGLTEKAVKHAVSRVKDELYLSSIRKQKQKLIFIGDKAYEQGIIGLIAGKLADRFNLPSIVLSIDKKLAKASGRSVSNFNIVDAVRQVSDLLVDVGGHPRACGFTVETKNIKKLKKRLIKIVNLEIAKKELKKIIKIDTEINLNQVNRKLYDSIKKLSPFGIDNPEPVFVSKSLELIGASQIGKAKNHLKLKLKQRDGFIFEAIGFGMGDIFWKLSSRTRIDAVYTVLENEWNGNLSLQLKLKDVNILNKV